MKKFLNLKPLKILLSVGLAAILQNFIWSKPVDKHITESLTYAYSDNIRINYERIGYGHKNVVLLHGFGTSLHTWDDIKHLFPENEFTLYLIDMKGFGNSSKPTDDKYTIQEQANIVVQFIKDINKDSLYLIGHSYGGAVALMTQLLLLNDNSRTKISKLILIDCLAYVQEMPVIIEYLSTPAILKVLFLLSNKIKAVFILNKIFYDKSLINQKLIDRYKTFYEDDDIEYSFIASARQINQIGYDRIIESYKGIPTSCLIIWGKNDPVLSVDNGIRLSNDLPNSNLEIMDECGHAPQEEKPLVTFDKIYSFIQKH